MIPTSQSTDSQAEPPMWLFIIAEAGVPRSGKIELLFLFVLTALATPGVCTSSLSQKLEVQTIASYFLL